MSDPSLRDNCIEAAAKAHHAVLFPGHDWDTEADSIRENCRRTVTPSVGAALAEVGQRVEEIGTELRSVEPNNNNSYGALLALVADKIANELRH